MTEPASSPEPTVSTDTSTTPALSASAEGKREGKVGIAVKRIWDAFWRTLKKIIWGPGNRVSDKFWKKNAYGIIQSFGIFGTVILLWFVLPSLLRGILENRGAENGGALEKEIVRKEIVRDVYYLLIFVGAGLAATLGTWRGRQSERQLREFKRQIQDSRSERQVARFERQVARFEKAIDMATDHTSIDRRASGFQILKQIFSYWRKDFEHLIVENLIILQSISTAPFWITERKDDKILRELYENNRSSYSEEIEEDDVKNLFEITPEHKINSPALSLWQEITNWRAVKWGGLITTGAICSPIVSYRIYFAYVFFKINLNGVIFLAIDDGGGVNISTPDEGVHPGKRANFVGSYFVLTSMGNANVDYVNFFNSHFFAINYLEKIDKLDCGMSCKGTIFAKANLINCYFGETDFNDASFIGANISGSDFSQAKNLFKRQFKQGAYWVKPGRPQFPIGFYPDFADKLPNEPPAEEVMMEWEMEIVGLGWGIYNCQINLPPDFGDTLLNHPPKTER